MTGGGVSGTYVLEATASQILNSNFAGTDTNASGIDTVVGSLSQTISTNGGMSLGEGGDFTSGYTSGSFDSSNKSTITSTESDTGQITSIGGSATSSGGSVIDTVASSSSSSTVTGAVSGGGNDGHFNSSSSATGTTDTDMNAGFVATPSAFTATVNTYATMSGNSARIRRSGHGNHRRLHGHRGFISDR